MDEVQERLEASLMSEQADKSKTHAARSKGRKGRRIRANGGIDRWEEAAILRRTLGSTVDVDLACDNWWRRKGMPIPPTSSYEIGAGKRNYEDDNGK